MKKILSILFVAISLFSSEVKEEVTINPDYAIGKFQSKQTYYKI